MARKLTTTIRLDAEDVEALTRARADGVSSADLIRRGLRLVAAKYYPRRRRRPSVGLFVSAASKLGEESELFKDLEEWRRP
jgi:Arc/MetJ-type ribon-helix-helix transcriptional regulator